MAGRSGMLGDTLCALPIAKYYKKQYPDAQIIWPIGKRFSQGAPLYLNHPDIDKIFIFDGNERQESKRDLDIVNSCDIVVDPTPEHPDNRYPREFNIYSETFRMGGLTIDQWNTLSIEEQIPKLYRWFKPEPRPSINSKCISLWGFASYGNKEQKRNPTKEWYLNLLNKLYQKNIDVIQFGHPNDPDLGCPIRFNDLDFFHQIRLSLSTDLYVGTDSGSSLIMAAYQNIPVLTVLSDHWGHTNNPYALAPKGNDVHNFFAPGGCDNVSVDEIAEKIFELLD